VSSIRKTEAIRCRRRVHPKVWAPAAPVFRDGRIQVGVPRWPVCAFAETDYCYGIGTLTIKLDRIDWDHPVPYEGDTWLEVQGRVITRTGREGARRTVLVRAALLPLRPPRRRPRLRP
jgi:hypothetical protein